MGAAIVLYRGGIHYCNKAPMSAQIEAYEIWDSRLYMSIPTVIHAFTGLSQSFEDDPTRE